MEDRRKFQRFRPEESCIINHSKAVGTIADISMGGLACFCLDEEHCQEHGLPRVVDVYCRKGEVRVENLQIEVLSTEIIPGKFSEQFGVRKCRIRFATLGKEQISQLENLIILSILPDSLPPKPDSTP